MSGYEGAFGDDNFAILAGSDSDFTAPRALRFTQDGSYGLLFTYTGPTNNFLMRVGIGLHNNDVVATVDGNTHFTASNAMWEILDAGDSAPSEFVPAGEAWAFNHEKANLYDIATGLIEDVIPSPCGGPYNHVWAISADSFGNDTTDFPYLLQNEIAVDFAWPTDSVPGRTLAQAISTFDSLLALDGKPDYVVRPSGVIIEGGVNDIVQSATMVELEQTVETLLTKAQAKGLKVIIMTVSPFMNNQTWKSEREIVRTDYNSWLIDRAASDPNIAIYDAALPASSGGLANDSNILELAPQFDSGDGLHPNVDGGRQLANHFKVLIDSMQ